MSVVSEPKLRVMIADDHTMIRKGLKFLLEAEVDIEVVAEASSGEQAILLARKHHPSEIVMDITMPETNGIDATRKILLEFPEIKVLFLSSNFDREIIHRIADSTHLSERVVSSLDEKHRELLTDWLAAITGPGYLSPAEYRYHLSRIVGTVARHGGAVILGRGAHLILGPGAALRVLVVAPLEPRVRAVMKSEGLSEREARRRIVTVEADRKAFLMKHFHDDLADLTTFDIVLNTVVLGVEGACGAIRAALERMPAWPAETATAR